MFAKAWIEGLALKSTARTFIALALFWACLLATGAHANSEISYFRIGTGGIAGTYYPIGAEHGELIGTERAGEDMRHVDDANSLEGLHVTLSQSDWPATRPRPVGTVAAQ